MTKHKVVVSMKIDKVQYFFKFCSAYFHHDIKEVRIQKGLNFLNSNICLTTNISDASLLGFFCSSESSTCQAKPWVQNRLIFAIVTRHLLTDEIIHMILNAFGRTTNSLLQAQPLNYLDSFTLKEHSVSLFLTTFSF